MFTHSIPYFINDSLWEHLLQRQGKALYPGALGCYTLQKQAGWMMKERRFEGDFQKSPFFLALALCDWGALPYQAMRLSTRVEQYHH